MPDAFLLEPATLDPIVYEPVLNDEAQRVGWRVPKNEQRRWNQGSGYTGEQPKPAPLSADFLCAELDQFLYLDSQLATTFRTFHAAQPERAQRLARHVIDGARSGSLSRPDAFLASRLRRET